MKAFLKVISQGQPQNYPKQDGTQSVKCQIVLQEIGNQYEDAYVCTMLGNLAQSRFYPGDLVYANIRFGTHQYNEQTYQDITVQDLISFTHH